MRYEVRIYHLEEFTEENRMTYRPCDSYEEAKGKYLEELQAYAEDIKQGLQRVDLCRVNYGMYGESVFVMASSSHENPLHVIRDEEYLEMPNDEEGECDGEDEDGCVDPLFAYATGQGPCPLGYDD